MKLFVYSLREYDEKQYFDYWCESCGVTYSSTAEAPKPHNLHLAEGCDAISIITTPLDAEMLATLKAGGVKCVSTRTVGYDHVDIKAAQELGIKVSQVEATVKLIDEGCTIPFIARYRKEVTGSLNDEILRDL